MMWSRSPSEDTAGVQKCYGIVYIYTSKEGENSICCHYIMEYRDNNKMENQYWEEYTLTYKFKQQIINVWN